MAAAAPASTSWVPQVLRIDGPFGYAIDPLYKIYTYAHRIFSDSLAYINTTSGQKTFFIKFPEAIVSIAKRIGPPVSISGRMLNSFAHFLTPLHALGGCAKPFIAFVDVVVKLKPMFAAQPTQREYLVFDSASPLSSKFRRAQFPFSRWEQWANRGQSIADWTLSFLECSSYLRKFAGNPADDKWALAAWSSRYISAKMISCESWFLYHTWWLGKHEATGRGLDETKVNVRLVGQTSLSKLEIVGSLLKIALSVVCLSIDLFAKLNERQSKPYWLEAAIFWTRITPTFLTPVALRYPNVVTKPLYNERAT